MNWGKQNLLFPLGTFFTVKENPPPPRYHSDPPLFVSLVTEWAKKETIFS